MSARRVTLPTDPDAFWDYFAWPSKAPGDSLPFELDCKGWLTDSGAILESVDVEASPGLTVGTAVLTGAGNVATLVTVQIAGGTPDTIATVALTLNLDIGVKVVSVALEIEDALPDDLVPVSTAGAGLALAGQFITVGGQPVTIGGF